jgi:hypothetical protein
MRHRDATKLVCGLVLAWIRYLGGFSDAHLTG